MANARSSQDERKLEGGSPAPQDNGLHPGFYIACVLRSGHLDIWALNQGSFRDKLAETGFLVYGLL